MIGTVHLRVAVQATLAEQKLGWHAGGQSVCVVSDAWMSGLRMTTLTQQRRATGQHARIVGTMWRMTQSAIFTDGRVLPKVRAAFFCVALVTGVIQRLAYELG